MVACAFMYAQPPQMFNYQALVKDAGGNVVTNQQVSFQFSILEGSDAGTAVYTETHESVQVSSSGQVNIAIGTGTSVDDFSAIDWGSNDYYLVVAMDPANGTSYEDLGASQLLSVPYALHAGSVNSGGGEVFTGAVELNANVKVGEEGLWFSEIVEISDTTDPVENYVTLVLPRGYTALDTRVLSVEIIEPVLNGTNYYGLGYEGTNGIVSYKLNYFNPMVFKSTEKADFGDINAPIPLKSSNKIYIYYPDELKDMVFRVVLMKIRSRRITL
jgi:hypothetical protein